MSPQAKPKFPRRSNVDGTYDSICIVCLMTVATVRNEYELAKHEEAHVCDGVRLHQLGRYPILTGSGFDLLR